MNNQDPVSVTVRYIGGWYHCRVFVRGQLYSEQRTKLKCDIGWSCREQLRWVDKLGYVSDFASAARHRQTATRPQGKVERVEVKVTRPFPSLMGAI